MNRPGVASLKLCLGAVALLLAVEAVAEGSIRWDRSSDRVVSHTGKAAAYPRAKRLSNGDILLGYHHGGGLGEYGTWVSLRRSADGGKTWKAARDVEGPEGEEFWGFSNVDFIELGGGRMLLVTAGRGKAVAGQPEFLSECARSELRLRFSDDFGATWGPPRSLSRGRGRVWEPSAVQLPSGEFEIYFANEAPDLLREGRLDQRIEIVRSRDAGETWSLPVEVSQHPGARNGMPSAIVLRNGRVACAQELVRGGTSPWITQTKHGRPVEEYLAQTRHGFGAAPFLLGVDGRFTLLAFHSGEGKQAAPPEASVPWMFTNVFVQRGDANAKSFGDATQPWGELPPGSGVFFPSLLMKDERTIVALASFLTHGEGETSRTEVHWIEGELDPEPQR